MNRSLLIAGIAATTLVLGACASKPKELPPEPGTANTQTTQPPMQPSGPVPGSQADFMASVMSDTVLFDLDRYNIDASDQGILQSQAQWLSRYPNKSVTIEGHADERGTRDYNLALGERRANAAKNYLVSLGIEPGRVMVVSYGKERPIALGSDEESWARNRRAVTVTVN
ncbi:MAG: peptidoglycan-associated lipoprotein [Novosphingobium sp. 17-62-19]|uniref:peptidoglycan-associated lipoprotein Pal n=1 Tax=Novosphingobium sp. 17-62-19 TaxID=1970406 RepID=UPI000BC4A4C6|nr:peptidoglycan-associated lipoprotein Pal [Novosphingobium sp. 17-62-19]OZA18606.1 MAG: peptidoglycan-associated lipoprotein [Novosphingobium sp. 17-62-19]HQS97867.1 peptidoglycan-associated lipoprotein Pal [Novosphingobium sp.]